MTTHLQVVSFIPKRLDSDFAFNLMDIGLRSGYSVTYPERYDWDQNPDRSMSNQVTENHVFFWLHDRISEYPDIDVHAKSVDEERIEVNILIEAGLLTAADRRQFDGFISLLRLICESFQPDYVGLHQGHLKSDQLSWDELVPLRTEFIRPLCFLRSNFDSTPAVHSLINDLRQVDDFVVEDLRPGTLIYHKHDRFPRITSPTLSLAQYSSNERG